ncbi:MAG: site-2 protease family protein [Candidatus Brocadiia bacterium]|jgi:Zn-dependent protease|nr:site-2 protease family protein [Candidatus Brocadiia bacterium]
MPMFGRNRTLFRIFGFPIRMRFSWLLLVALVIYTLGGPEGLFNNWLDEPASPLVCLGLGVLGAAGLFASLLTHELCHSIVARRTGMPVQGITLFVFGGVSELGGEPPTPGAEFFMAIVGPLSSAFIGAAFTAVWFLGGFVGLPRTLSALVGYLAIVNWLLAVFNSVPAFPLDGGRVMRSVLWWHSGDLRWATRWAARLGSAAGLAMMAVGVLMIVNGLQDPEWAFPLPGVWLAFIGFFVRQAASSSLQHTLLQHALRGEGVRHLMSAGTVTVPPYLTLRRFVEDYVLPCRIALFPVVNESGLLVGVAGARDPARCDQANWDAVTVGDIMRTAAADILIDLDAPAAEVLVRLSARQAKGLVVVREGRPVGIVSLRDLMEFVAIKTDLSLGARAD